MAFEATGVRVLTLVLARVCAHWSNSDPTACSKRQHVMRWRALSQTKGSITFQVIAAPGNGSPSPALSMTSRPLEVSEGFWGKSGKSSCAHKRCLLKYCLMCAARQSRAIASQPIVRQKIGLKRLRHCCNTLLLLHASAKMQEIARSENRCQTEPCRTIEAC